MTNGVRDRPGRQPNLAVVADRAADLDELDYFPSPPWAGRAGGHLIQVLDPGPWSCWEPACGEGHLAHGLADYFARVSCSDIAAYGCPHSAVLDFLDPAADRMPAVDWIVTNPPFIRGEAFVRAAWRRARRGVAMLVRLAFLESEGRFVLFDEHPLAVVAPFGGRVSMVKGVWDPNASRPTAYAWLIWLKPEVRETCQLALPPPPDWLGRVIDPAAKALLTRRSDLERFAPHLLRAGGDLFEGATDGA